MPALVKGAGYAKPGGNKPLEDDGEIFTRSLQAEKALRASVKKSLSPGGPEAVRKGLNPAFTSQFGMFLQQQPGAGGLQQFAQQLEGILSTELGKNITLTSPLTSGLVPYDLVAPSRLIYPVYSPLRNKLPRVPGQGTSHRAKVLTGIQGSQTGSGNGPARLSMSELNGGSLTANWPINLPAAGNQTAVDVNIPYQFFGRTESLSWLAQFAGQGFEDVSALANLILLQEFMLGEEYQLLSGTSASIAQPAASTLVMRTPGTGETAISGVGNTNIYVAVTGVTDFGETAYASGSVASVASAASVLDITLKPVNGAYSYNIYVAAGSAAPARGSFFLVGSNVGGKKWTLQGVFPTAGTNPPSVDTGTSSSTDYEGFLSILDGHAVTDASVYPSGFTAGYINKSVGTKLNHTALYNAFEGVWNNPNGTGNTSTTGGFRADPAEIICEGSDAARLSDEIIAAGTGAAAYRIFTTQDEVAGMRTGAAVSEVQNPITRSVVKLVVHPWLRQGTAIGASYTLPMSWTNVSNVWENVMVQDYLSVSWPVIDASFRYSMFQYGALVCYAPQYNFLLQGLQVSDTTPYV